MNAAAFMSLPHSTRKMPIPYKGFPSFTEWSTYTVDVERWEQVMSNLKGLEVCSDILQRIRLIIKDAASTYHDKMKVTDKDETKTYLFKSICESFILDGRIDANHVLESQLTAYDYVMDFAVKGDIISKSWLCRLHSLICSTQQGRVASKAICAKDGPYQVGKYKHLSNKIAWGKGRAIFGAPVNRTSAEMLKYCRELRSKAFLEAHPILQASYAHYALVAVHPFVNGNGRVARLLAFSFMYRSNSVPALFLDEDRVEYASALRAADLGNFQPFINLVQERSIESATLIKERILSAMQNS